MVLHYVGVEYMDLVHAFATFGITYVAINSLQQHSHATSLVVWASYVGAGHDVQCWTAGARPLVER